MRGLIPVALTSLAWLLVPCAAAQESTDTEEQPPADEASAASPEATPDPESAPAPAADVDTIPVAGDAPPEPEPARGSATQLDDLVVTGQKRKQPLHDVSASEAVISGEEIMARGLISIEEVTRSIPNVTMSNENLLTIYTIRGMGAVTNYSFDPSMSAIVDDVPLPIGVITASFLDLEAIEILRGPQGTLFGKNTVAGALKLTTKDPGTEWSGYANLQGGSYGGGKLEAVGNVPLWEGAGARLRYAGEKRDGYMYNTFRDEDDGGEGKETISAKLLTELSPSLSLTLNGTYETFDFPTGYGYQAIVCPQEYRDLAEGSDPDFECEVDQQASRDEAEHADYWARIANGVLSWALGGYELKAVASYYDYEVFFTYDADVTPIAAYTLPTLAYGEAHAGELRLLSPLDLQAWDRELSFVAGLYYNSERPVIDTTLNIASSGPPANLPAERLRLYQDKLVTEIAGFGQADYEIVDRVTLTAGARYSSIRTVAKRIGNENSCAGLPVGCIGTAGGNANAYFEGLEIDDRALSTKVALGYELTDDIRPYLSYATGFKPGGFGLSVFSDGMGGAYADPYDAERSVSYEGGAKLRFFNNILQVNLAAFASEYEDFQVLITRLFASETSNAAQAKTRGGELETRLLLPFDIATVQLGLNGGYVDARYVDYRNATCPASEAGTDSDNNPVTPGICDLSGRQLANAPEWKGSLLLDVKVPLGGWPFLLTLGGDTTWQDLTYFQSDTDPNDVQPAYWRHNVSAGLAGIAGNWRLQFFVDNVGDGRHLQTANDIPLIRGAHYGSMAPPRWYSASLSYSF